MENQELTPKVEEQLTISKTSTRFLNETRKWANFLGIMGFIGVGFMLVAALAMFVVFSFIPEANNPDMPFDLSYFSLFYVVFAIIYFFPVYYLFQFSLKMKTALTQKDNNYLEESLGFLKSHYKFMGILTIVMLASYPIIIVGIVIFSLGNM